MGITWSFLKLRSGSRSMFLSKGPNTSFRFKRNWFSSSNYTFMERRGCLEFPQWCSPSHTSVIPIYALASLTVSKTGNLTTSSTPWSILHNWHSSLFFFDILWQAHLSKPASCGYSSSLRVLYCHSNISLSLLVVPILEIEDHSQVYPSWQFLYSLKFCLLKIPRNAMREIW